MDIATILALLVTTISVAEALVEISQKWLRARKNDSVKIRLGGQEVILDATNPQDISKILGALEKAAKQESAESNPHE
jgi:hypothetical protein